MAFESKAMSVRMEISDHGISSERIEQNGQEEKRKP